MIISHKYKFIFVKTRKVGGTSLEYGLKTFLDSNDILTYQDNIITGQNCNKNIDPHLSASEIAEMFPYEWKNYFKFTIERNSWDKMASFYFYYKSDNSRKTKGGFSRFVEKHSRICSDWKNYTQNNKIIVDHVIDYSNLEKELKKLNLLNRDINLVENKILSGFRTDKEYRYMYDELTENFIRECFSKEISYFNFQF